MKKCTLCGKKKELSDFYKNSSMKDGLAIWCVLCARRESQKRRESNGEKDRNRSARWRSANSEKVKSNNKEYYLENKEKIKQNISTRLSVLENREKVSDSSRNWRIRNKEKVKLISFNWKKKHPENNSVYKQNRRARKNNNGGSYSVSEWKDLKEKYGNMCLCCKRNNLPLQPDHVVPLALGGRNSIDNIQPLCQHCNSVKNTKSTDYRKQYGEVRGSYI